GGGATTCGGAATPDGMAARGGAMPGTAPGGGTAGRGGGGAGPPARGGGGGPWGGGGGPPGGPGGGVGRGGEGGGGGGGGGGVGPGEGGAWRGGGPPGTPWPARAGEPMASAVESGVGSIAGPGDRWRSVPAAWVHRALSGAEAWGSSVPRPTPIWSSAVPPA